MAANAKPDGYTISHIPITVFRFPFMQKTPYDPLADFTYIIHLSGFMFGVGDNVGDCAGMAADLFETYAVTTVATMVLAAIFFANTPILLNMMTLPLAIGGVCILTSIAGTFFVKLPANQSIMGALYRGLIATGVLSIVGLAIVMAILVGFRTIPGAATPAFRSSSAGWSGSW